MAVYLESGDQQVQAATNAGWASFADWARALDPADVPDLSHLVDHGWADDPERLAADCRSAASPEPPADILSVLRSVEQFAAEQPAGEAVLVTAGMTDAPAGDDAGPGDDAEGGDGDPPATFRRRP